MAHPAKKPASPVTGAENIHWDLSVLYKGLDDPTLSADIAEAEKRMAAFHKNFKGHLGSKLAEALAELQAIHALENKIFYFLFLMKSCANGDEKIEQMLARAGETLSRAGGEYLTFFDHELGNLDEKAYEKQVSASEIVAKHKPMLDHTRKLKQYLLSEEVERALTLRSPFGTSEWDNYRDELESLLRFSFDDRDMTLAELLHVVNQDTDPARRYRAMETINAGLGEKFARFSGRSLNIVMGAKGVEDRERRHPHPMHARNLSNRVEDATVEALHEAVCTDGVVQLKRYYRLFGKLLGIQPLKWSDRNAPLPFSDTRTISWDEAVKTVETSYRRFSPTLGDMVKAMVDENRVDGPVGPAKDGGAFNASFVMPDGTPMTFTLMNYLGSPRDVMTLAHEFGHGVHGLLAGAAQGPLQSDAPMAYAETASIFGEMLVFENLLEQAKTDEQKLVLLMDKSGDFINSVHRQISFSLFEQRLHAARAGGKLTMADFTDHWMAVTKQLYGEEGELFTYGHMDQLWSYVGHFMRPFYVYAYAFGELFTQSLFAVKDGFGKDFEPMYLELLKAGSSKTPAELMAPFGLDPADPDFWKKGISGSLTRWLDEAEKLSSHLKAK